MVVIQAHTVTSTRTHVPRITRMVVQPIRIAILTRIAVVLLHTAEAVAMTVATIPTTLTVIATTIDPA